ncbi:UNVERIFIED_CONTAM: Replication factor C subunit [Sesamum radiatum]|uniref:Replication factor C subunit n=1 Tax=Sesamum radiatum TaxID=300843 RepID=A0AAW2NA42_SESRA
MDVPPGDGTSDNRRVGSGKRRAATHPEPVDGAPTANAPCGACKFLRRKCVSGCIFAPHFGSDQGAARFAAVHKVFGASNVSKLLMHIPANRRHDAVVTISYEAQARLSDPVYGCVSTIIALQQQVASLQAELSVVQTQLINTRFAMANALHHNPPQQQQQQQQQQHIAAAYSNTSSASNTLISMHGFSPNLGSDTTAPSNTTFHDHPMNSNARLSGPTTATHHDHEEEEEDESHDPVTEQDCPHLLFYGPSGSGKKTLIMALLRQMFGPSADKVKVENKNWKVDAGTRTIDVELTTLSSTHHVELNPSDAGFQDRYVVQEIIKEMAKNRPIDTKGKKGFKVLVLNEVDKLSREAQHSLRRTMEKYSASCRLILCCNSSSKVTEAVRYPFTINQAIPPMDWEEYVSEIASSIFKEQSPKRLFEVRGKLYELLINCIPPEIILKRLLYELLKKLDSELKHEISHWAAYYEHRLRLGQKAIFHLEAFVAKFMSIYKGFLIETFG